MTTAERKELLHKVDSLIRQRYFDPKFNGRNWPELVREHESRIVNASDDEGFEREMNVLLGRLGTSHTHFLSPRHAFRAAAPLTRHSVRLRRQLARVGCFRTFSQVGRRTAPESSRVTN